MEANIESWLRTLWEGAAATIAWEIVVWGALGALVCVVAVLVFKLVTGLILGDPSGPWGGAWHASVVVSLIVAAGAGLTIGAGQGALDGAEVALRSSDFGRKTLPKLTSQGVSLYAIAYFTDPESLKTKSPGELLSLRKINEVREFSRGGGSMQTDRLDERMQMLQGDRLLNMARSAQEDVGRLTPMIEKELPGLGKASELVREFALKPSVTAEELGGLAMAPLKDVRSAASLHGDPSTVTHGELSEHLRERVAIPALLSPLIALVRPWQFGALVALALMALFLLALRLVVWRTAEPDELANSADSN